MPQRSLTVHVECHSGYRADESPRRFHIGERTVEVVEVIDRWLAPGRRYFKLRGDDDGIYILCQDETGDWEMTLYDSGRHPPTRLSST